MCLTPNQIYATQPQLVQEFMLLANRCVADFCVRHKIPIPYRIHQFPDDASNIKAIYNSVTNHEALMPFLGRASYSAEAKNHDALAFPSYCHFTSPIRRYADVLVHRQLHRFYRKEPLQSQEGMQEKVAAMNQAEQTSEKRQTAIRYIERLQVQFQQSDKKVKAVVERQEGERYRLKPLSNKHDFSFMLPVSEVTQSYDVGDTLHVTQKSCYHVMHEYFECHLNE